MHIDETAGDLEVGQYLLVEAYELVDPATYSDVWADRWLQYYTAQLIKRQWGLNMMKFSGTKLPGGIELNGRQYYDDAERELAEIKSRMALDYELPPLDFIG